MGTFIKLINLDGAIIYSNLEDKLESYFLKCEVKNELIEKCIFSGRRARHGKILSDRGTSYIFSYDSEMVSRPRFFKEKLEIYSGLIPEFNEIKAKLTAEIQANNRRLIHNITSLNAHNIQELYSVVSEDKISKDFKQIKELIKQYLNDNPDGAADTFLRIAKNSIAIKSEFTVFKKLDGEIVSLPKRTHSLKKVVLTVLHVFYPDFKEKDVLVLVEDKNQLVKFDFETMRVALHHMLDNTAKYIMPGSSLRIKFQETEFKHILIFDMFSIEILDSEREEIFNEGFSGTYAKKMGMNGDGLGLYIVKRILKLNDALLFINHDTTPKNIKKINGVQYQKNIFEIVFKK